MSMLWEPNTNPRGVRLPHNAFILFTLSGQATCVGESKVVKHWGSGKFSLELKSSHCTLDHNYEGTNQLHREKKIAKQLQFRICFS